MGVGVYMRKGYHSKDAILMVMSSDAFQSDFVDEFAKMGDNGVLTYNQFVNSLGDLDLLRYVSPTEASNLFLFNSVNIQGNYMTKQGYFDAVKCLLTDYFVPSDEAEAFLVVPCTEGEGMLPHQAEFAGQRHCEPCEPLTTE